MSNSISLNRAANSAQSARFRTGRLRNNPTKRPKKGGDKCAVAVVKKCATVGFVHRRTLEPDTICSDCTEGHTKF